MKIRVGGVYLLRNGIIAIIEDKYHDSYIGETNTHGCFCWWSKEGKALFGWGSTYDILRELKRDP